MLKLYSLPVRVLPLQWHPLGLFNASNHHHYYAYGCSMQNLNLKHFNTKCTLFNWCSNRLISLSLSFFIRTIHPYWCSCERENKKKTNSTGQTWKRVADGEEEEEQVVAPASNRLDLLALLFGVPLEVTLIMMRHKHQHKPESERWNKCFEWRRDWVKKCRFVTSMSRIAKVYHLVHQDVPRGWEEPLGSKWYKSLTKRCEEGEK